ncbi:serine/threonine-protein kinase, partial [Actinocorallia longicatena]|uniref:serine/threonine-protein kinase n=1 Tax=Actinocorallia longicatena TaxID=111803 RepID=UPI0031DF8B83
MDLDGLIEIGTLGSGAQGRVALARDAEGRTVAVKYSYGEVTDAFREEARMMARLRHPNVVEILGFEERPDGAAIIMEAVPGAPLSELLDRHGALPPEAALSVLRGSLLGLCAAHDIGVVHRDYKPSNVMVTAEGESKLVDFGIAVFAGGGGRSGTPAYMAPEQWAGGAASPATDVYAATCVFVECVAGRRPFGGETLAALEAGHRTAPVPEELVPEALRPLVRHGMAKRPQERPRDAAVFGAELEVVAAREYGPDWAARGAGALAGTAAGLVAVLPWLAG